MDAEREPPISSTALSFEILAALHERDGATLAEMADHFERPESTVHDHLTTLSELGYLYRDGQIFRVSVRFLSLGGRARSRTDLFQVAEREVDQLAFDTGEHANLMVEQNGFGIFLYKAKGPQSVTLDTYEGMEVHLHTTAMGKAILARTTLERRQEIVDARGLPGVTQNTITDRDSLDEEMAEIRDRGYAVDDEERVEGVRCIAAPVLRDDGVVGAVSVSAPRSRMSERMAIEDLPSQVLGTANVIEINLQHR